MNLSEIYYLIGVTDVLGFRATEGPTEGDAVHGEGVTLMINDKKYAVNFNTLTHTMYEGQDAIAFAQFIPDNVIGLFTMDGSFTTDQIRKLYDYRIVSYDQSREITVRADALGGGYVLMSDPPVAVFPDLGTSANVPDIFMIDMKRYIQVDAGAGDPAVVYLRDCATESVEVEPGVYEDVVYFHTVLENAGLDTSQGMYLHEFWLIAADDFISTWTYNHNHLIDMYFRPDADRGYTTDPDLAAYGGRVSTKAVYEIELHDVPQAAPSIQVVVGDQTLWGSDANACEGCHYKNDAIQIPIDCFSCHAAP